MSASAPLLRSATPMLSPKPQAIYQTAGHNETRKETKNKGRESVGQSAVEVPEWRQQNPPSAAKLRPHATQSFKHVTTQQQTEQNNEGKQMGEEEAATSIA